jgi:hypothetical protein
MQCRLKKRDNLTYTVVLLSSITGMPKDTRALLIKQRSTLRYNSRVCSGCRTWLRGSTKNVGGGCWNLRVPGYLVRMSHPLRKGLNARLIWYDLVSSLPARSIAKYLVVVTIVFSSSELIPVALENSPNRQQC